MVRRPLVYRTVVGRSPYVEYLDGLRDRVGVAKIRTRANRAKLGNLGDHKSVGHGVIELRIDHGPGYRLYVGLHGQELIVLLCAGDKASQFKDILKAIAYWEDFLDSGGEHENLSEPRRLPS
ncbi:MAG: type II toxin-antitoxin system RelE/ParE family toxin [Elusimicrobiota bacterium]